MIKKINYENKVAIQNDEDIENKNKVTDADMNEIKEVVNNNADELTEAQENISDIQEEQETQNTKIETLETDNTTNKKDISDLKEENETQETSIEELQENLSDAQQEIEALRTIQNALPVVNGEGENITLKGTAENATFKKFKICGNSRQETREGYNLLDINDIENWTQWKTENFKYKKYQLKANTSYTVSQLKNRPSTGTVSETSYLYITSGEEVAETLSYSINGALVGQPRTVVSDENGYIIVYVWTTDTTFTDDLGLMLCEGTEEKDYEAYGASPSPDYPSKIESVGDDVNLYPGWEVGNIDASTGKEISDTAYIRSIDFIPILPNQKYTIKAHNKINFKNINTGARMYDKDKNYLGNQYLSNILNNSYTFALTNSEVRYIKLVHQNGVYVENDAKVDIKFQKGEKATAYSKFGEGTASAKISNKNIARNITYFNTKNQYASMVNLEYYFEKDKNYRISFDTPNTGIQIYLQGQGDDTNYSTETWQSCYCDGERHSFKVTGRKTKNTKITWGLICRNTATSDVESGLLSNLMIEEVESSSSSATDYVEHQEQNFTMPTQKEMLEEDYFDLDTLEEVHNWNEIDISTLLSKDIAIGSTSTDEYYVFQIPLCSETQRAKEVLCEKFKFLGFETASVSRKEEGITINTDAKRFGRVWIKASRLSEKSITAFLNWCSEENIIVKVLIEDVEERLPMTAEQIAIAKQIKNTLISYKDTTHVYSEDKLSPIFKCSAIADMTAMLDNLQAQILAEEV